MKNKQETFASLMDSFVYHYDLRPVFDDFLTMSLCAVTQIPGVGKSRYENLYMETVAKYAKDDLRHNFPKMFSCLILQMDERVSDGSGNDVLGEYYEQNFTRKNTGQVFTPFPVCKMMSKMIAGDNPEEPDRPLRILDPTCGSGRMLVAAAKNLGWRHEYYGIDIDHTCVKMTALNLFLNGIFHSEVMWADALAPNDFRISYALSFLPLGVFRIEQKEKSNLWHLHRNSFATKQPLVPPLDLTLPSETGEKPTGVVSQLHLF